MIKQSVGTFIGQARAMLEPVPARVGLHYIRHKVLKASEDPQVRGLFLFAIVPPRTKKSVAEFLAHYFAYEGIIIQKASEARPIKGRTVVVVCTDSETLGCDRTLAEQATWVWLAVH